MTNSLIRRVRGSYGDRRYWFDIDFARMAGPDAHRVIARAAMLRTDVDAASTGSLDQQLDVARQGLSTVKETLAHFVVAWNLIDDEGREIPCTAAGVRSLPDDFAMHLANEMVAVRQPGSANGFRSFVSRSRKGRRR